MRKVVLRFGVPAVLLLVCGVVTAVAALTDDNLWSRTGAPTLQKMVDLPDSTAINVSNANCSQITTRIVGWNDMHGVCVSPTAMGLAGNSTVTFTGSSEAVRIELPGYLYGLEPVPNQGLFYAQSSASVVGSYLHFYRSLMDKIEPSYDYDTHLITKYRITKPQDMSLRDSSGNLLPINPDNIAFSPNGNWMVVEVYYQGFVRINMATFDMVPFAPPLNAAGDYASHYAQLSITNDGNYVAVKPTQYDQLYVYDLQTCKDATLPVDSSRSKCQSRDYWPVLQAQAPGFNSVFTPRFTTNSKLTVTVRSNYISGSNYKMAQYTLTAPGENPTGMQYLGMGDSYASGQGAFSYFDSTDTTNNACHLSSLSYPVLLSSLLFSSGRSVACSGARLKDIFANTMTYAGQNMPHKTRAELQAAGMFGDVVAGFRPGYLLQSDYVERYGPQAITLSIGGNDIGFADIVKQCVMPSLKNATCFSTYEEQQELKSRISGIQDKLRIAYRALASPGRTVYVIGYPQIVNGGGVCASNVHLNAQEVQIFMDLTDTLNQTIQTAAAAANVQYVDVSDAFKGHRMCEAVDGQVAVNGLTAGNDSGVGGLKLIGAESYHPNALGHELLLQAILLKTNNLRNTASLTSTPVPGVLPYANAPKSGRATNLVVNAESLLPDVVQAGQAATVQADNSSLVLKPASNYEVKLDNATTTTAIVTTDGTGVLTGTLTLPVTVSCGYHIVHVYGPNMIGQASDMYKVVYVSSTACSQRAVDAPCGGLPAADADIDNDGIDDGCDPIIGGPPPDVYYQVYLTGSSIQATR